MIINKKRYYTISDIFEKYKKTMPFKIVVNHKFYVEATLSEFHKSIYKEAICSFKYLPLLDYEIEPYSVRGKSVKFYVESDVFEKELLRVEDEWYENNNNLIKKKKGEVLWF